ncbi:hypothetical protein ACM66B_006894 [Microbotryomycetes sp. NB124-2]
MVAVDDAELKPWLQSQLEPISDADPAVLSDYILALLKHDGSIDELKASCQQQLVDFLGDETSEFVAQLFFRLTAPRSLARLDDQRRARPVQRQPARTDEDQLMGDSQTQYNPHEPQQQMQNSQHPTSSDQTNQQPLCRDYHERGFCARGNACPYQHDAASIPMPMPNNPWAFFGMPPPTGAGMPFFGGGPHFQGMSLPMAQHGMHSGPRQNGAPQAQRQKRQLSQREQQKQQRQRDHAARPDSVKTVRVTHIPDEHLSQHSVHKWFSRFGQLAKVVVDPDRKRALVTFANTSQMHAALKSPDAVFGNRFVRVGRAKISLHDAAPSEQQALSAEAPAFEARPVPSTPYAPYRRPGVESSSRAPGRPGPVSNAALLEQSARQQKALLDKLDETEDETQKEQLMTQLRKLSKEAKALRSKVKFETASSGAKQPTPEEILAQLRAEAAALGIDTSVAKSGDPQAGEAMVVSASL